MGPGKYTNKNVDSLQIMGPLTGAGLTASTIDVYGPTILSKGSEIGTAIIRGPLTATDTIFTGTVKTYGAVQATDVTFNDSLSVEGNDTHVSLDNSSAQGITIIGSESGSHISASGSSVSYSFSSSKKKAPGNRVILIGKDTVVTGPIEFVNSSGTVTLMDGATYVGTLINGTLQKEESIKAAPTKLKEGVLE